MLTLGNLPEDIQHQPIAREDVAYFPDLDKQDVSVKSHKPFCRVLLFHRCWEKLLANFDHWKEKGPLMLLPHLMHLNRSMDSNL